MPRSMSHRHASRSWGRQHFPPWATPASSPTTPPWAPGPLVPKGIEPPAFQRVLHNPDQNFNGPGWSLSGCAPGSVPPAGREDMQRLAHSANTLFAADPRGQGNTVAVLGVQRPAQIVNYRSVGSTPVILAVGLAAGCGRCSRPHSCRVGPPTSARPRPVEERSASSNDSSRQPSPGRPWWLRWLASSSGSRSGSSSAANCGCCSPATSTQSPTPPFPSCRCWWWASVLSCSRSARIHRSWTSSGENLDRAGSSNRVSH